MSPATFPVVMVKTTRAAVAPPWPKLRFAKLQPVGKFSAPAEQCATGRARLEGRRQADADCARALRRHLTNLAERERVAVGERVAGTVSGVVDIGPDAPPPAHQIGEQLRVDNGVGARGKRRVEGQTGRADEIGLGDQTQGEITGQSRS